MVYVYKHASQACLVFFSPDLERYALVWGNNASSGMNSDAINKLSLFLAAEYVDSVHLRLVVDEVHVLDNSHFQV
jgi:hypothetical protein